MSSILRTYFRDAWHVYRQGEQPAVSLDDGAFPAFLVWDIRGDIVEIPACLIQHFLYAKPMGYSKVVLNLVNGPDSNGRRTFHLKTASTILAKFEEAGDSSMRLAHVVTTKGVHYYGGKGIILDGDYNPLMLTTLKVKFAADGSPRFSDPVFNLSYRVFENSAELVEKTIIKQAIPLYALGTVDGSYDGDYYFDGDAKVSISNLDSIIVRPSTPSLATATTEMFNLVIAQNYGNL